MAAEISAANGWDAPSDDTLLGPCAFSRAFSCVGFAWPRKHLRACAKVAKKNGRKMGAKMGGEMGGGDARNGRKNGRTKNGRTSWGWMLFVDMTTKRNPQILFQNHLFRYIADSMTGSGSENWRSKVVAPKCSFRITFLDTFLTQCLESGF